MLNNYIINSSIREIIRLLYVFVSYIFIYGYRSLGPLLKKKFERERRKSNAINQRLSKLEDNWYFASTKSKSRSNNIASQNKVKILFSQRIMDIHYETGVEEEEENPNVLSSALYSF